MNNYIKLNNNLDHLSLGNLFNMIKKNAINKSSAIQAEIFCTLFEIENISETTVGAYCTGYRAIGPKYKQIYLNFKKHYNNDELIMIPIINNLLSIIDGTINDYKTIKEIDNSKSLANLSHDLHILIKNDLYVPVTLKKEALTLLNKKEYYRFICKTLFFIILEKKQPLYEKDLVNETIEEILDNTNMSINDLKEYLEIEFKEGISFIPSLKELAKKNNPYALNRLGNLEYTGEITGYPRYEESYKYHKMASNFNHPTSYWMLAHMIINKQIGSLTEDDIALAWEYLEKAYKLGSISAANTIGLCHLKGLTKDHKKNIEKAILYFKEAGTKNYVYALNNLGKLYEEKKEFGKAIEYYTKSAALENSWACNKLGLMYFYGKNIEKNIQKSYDYFKIGADAPISTRYKWNIYNLVNLFYLKGNSILGIQKDINKSITLLESILPFAEAEKLLIEIK